MGCWNGTCGISNLPIRHGTEIYVFPIEEAYRDSFCYATALYRPSVLPFRAVYDDYGGGEDCSGVGLEVLMNGIKSKLVEVELGENEYHDIAVSKEGFGVDQFFEACHIGRLLFPNPMAAYEGNKPTNKIYFTMVRKDVVDRLWNEWAFDLWKPGGDVSVPAGFEADQYYIKNVTYARLATLIPDYMASRTERNNPFKGSKLYTNLPEDIDAESRKGILDYLDRHGFFEDHGKEHILSRTFGHAFSSGYAGGGFARIAPVADKILDHYFDGDKEVAYELMKECLIGIMVNSFMGHVRKIWTPPMHQGSQSECLEEYQMLNQISSDIVSSYNEEFESDGLDLFNSKGIYLLKDKIVEY